MKSSRIIIPSLILSLATGYALASDNISNEITVSTPNDSITETIDSIDNSIYTRLTDSDFNEVADELGVEAAAIKAVVDIEAGVGHEGFVSPGKPIINFDVKVFRLFAKKKGIDVTKYTDTHPVIFNKPNKRKYGSYQNAQYARLNAAMEIDYDTAVEGTFWGMFQIGGFNWKKCGASSINDFVAQMSRSERTQLDLFANFIRNSGMLPYLRDKNWGKFALRYNGPKYQQNGYHIRLAEAYAKHNKS